MNLPVYLDYNATTPCDPRVLEAMLPFFKERFGNAASRTHSFGWQAAEAVEMAGEQVADLIGASPGEIIFTSGATEAVNLAIKGVYEMYARKGNHIITSQAEHKAVLDTCKHLEKRGAEVTYLDVDIRGQTDLAALEAAIRPSTILVCLMYANNETGTISPVREIGQITRRHEVLFFSDATQAVGKVPVQVEKDQADLLAFSAHKFYGPKGVGALYVRRKNPRVRLTAQMDGGGHQHGMRSGTLNVPGIVGLGKACELSIAEMEQEAVRLRLLRDQLENALLTLEETRVNGDPLHRLPHVTNLSFLHVESAALMTSFQKEIAVSSGSACSSATPEPSHVLRAMGLNAETAQTAIRFSLGRFTTESEIGYVIERVTRAVGEQRKLSPQWLLREEITRESK